ncbi:MAG: T9SS type A sorting domain-containing protein [Bacteroidetes bacterium]|nr:T9SS type A sorting domain-containing protein [Bacteroidota bacterium]
MKKIKVLLLASASMIGISNFAFAQIQKGTDLEGDSENDFAGYAVSMPDANTLAFGAPYSDANLTDAGYVRIHHWNGNAWVQKGADINGEAMGDISGYALSMPDSNTIAIGAPNSDENGSNSGQVRIFSWNGSAWAQKGVDIAGAITTDKFGTSVSMPDANTVAVGAPFHNGIGKVYVYTWNGTAWLLRGDAIWGEGQSDQAGCAVSMPDANTLAIGALANQGTNGTAGHARIFKWNGSGWIQKGSDIDGEVAYDYFGNAVSMPDSNTVAIGGPQNDNTNGVDAGHVRIYDWNGSTWLQRGIDIDGDASSNGLGSSISMPDANTIAVGAPYYSSESGQVQVFRWNGSSWIQDGVDITGEATGDFCGTSVSMPDANTMAVGAPENNGAALSAGHTRVFTFAPFTGFAETIDRTGLNIYPNPAGSMLQIQVMHPSTIVVLNMLGQELTRLEIENNLALDVNSFEPGIYFVRDMATGQTVKFSKL